MAATYTPVTLGEMVELLTPAKGWCAVELERVQEHVLDWRVKRYAANIVVRVYTSVKKATGHGRGCGRDAIRVCAVNLDTDRGLVKSKRVHRVENWRENLKARITWVLGELDQQGHTRRATSRAVSVTPDPNALVGPDAPPAARPAPIPVGLMKPIPPHTPARLREKLRRANEAEARAGSDFACGGVADDAAGVESLASAAGAAPDRGVTASRPHARAPRVRKRPTLKAKYQR